MFGPFTRLRPVAMLMGCAMVAVAVVWSVPHAVGEEEDRPVSTDPAGRAGILVMRNGKVVDGRILKNGDDYTVQAAHGGIMFVPGSMVSLYCENLKEAYRKLHENAYRQNSAMAHCTLARWCIANKLTAEARLELNDALQLEPLHEEARNLLVRLDEMLDPKRPEEPKKPATLVALPKSTRLATDESESLGSLSREQAQHFTRRIQPILVNNCTAGGCHGPDSETGFRLQRVVPGWDTSRVASERNLAEVLEQIDLERPRGSPLLTVPRGNHGRRGRPVFTGPRGSEQLEAIRKWVLAVARSESAREERDGAPPPKSERIEQSSASADFDDRPATRHAAGSRRAAGDAGRAGSKRPAIDPFNVLRDPFDPQQFNRSAPSSGTRR